MRSLKIRKSAVPMAVSGVFIILLLLSDVSYYLRITPTGLFPGIVKTAFYAIVLLCGVWSFARKRIAVDSAILLFLCFTSVTLISTALGVPTDIAVWRQLIHLTFFAASFVVSYVATDAVGIWHCQRFLKFPFWLFSALYCFAALRIGISTQNAVYYLIVFLPILSFFKRPLLRGVLSVFLVLLTLLSNKRTMLVAVVAYFLVFELLSNRRITKVKFICKSILYTGGCIGLYFVFPIIIQALDITVFKELELSHILEDGGSNRFYIYGMLWVQQMRGSFTHWMIGDGYNAVLFSGICRDGILGAYVSAHNDYLEVLYDYGVVGLSLYLAFLGVMLKRGLTMVRAERTYGYAFVGSVVMVFIISLSSHLIIYLNYYVIFFLFWGMCLADHNIRRKHYAEREGGGSR